MRQKPTVADIPPKDATAHRSPPGQEQSGMRLCDGRKNPISRGTPEDGASCGPKAKLIQMSEIARSAVRILRRIGSEGVMIRAER